jgi:hypothetical protein
VVFFYAAYHFHKHSISMRPGLSPYRHYHGQRLILGLEVLISSKMPEKEAKKGVFLPSNSISKLSVCIKPRTPDGFLLVAAFFF